MGPHRPSSSPNHGTVQLHPRRTTHRRPRNDAGLGGLLWGGVAAMCLAVGAWLAFSKSDTAKPRRQTPPTPPAESTPAAVPVVEKRTPAPPPEPEWKAPVIEKPITASAPPPPPAPKPIKIPEGGGGLLSTFGSGDETKPTPGASKPQVPDAVAPPEKK